MDIKTVIDMGIIRDVYESIMHNKSQPIMHKSSTPVSDLNAFMMQAYNGRNINAAQSIKSLEDNLVEIRYNCSHSSNGIMITDSGFFLTALHCVDLPFNDLALRLYNGHLVGVERLNARKGTGDIALAKAQASRSYTGANFKVHLDKQVTPKSPVMILTRRNGKIEKDYGLIDNVLGNEILLFDDGGRLNSKDSYRIYLSHVWHGDSGGIVISNKGELMGIMCGLNKENGHSYATKISTAIDLIWLYIRKKQQ
jgi:hypothetical protein